MPYNDPQDTEHLLSGRGAEELLSAYALGVTTPEEAAQVEKLLAERPELARELEDYRRLGVTLGMDITALEPPPGALDRLMQIVAETEEPLVGPERPSRGLFAPTLRLSPLVAAAVLAVLLGLIAYLSAQMYDLRRTNDYLKAEAEAHEVALALMRSEDVIWLPMRNPNGEAVPSQAFAWLIFSPAVQSGVVLTNSFPEVPETMTYQMWMREDGVDESIGLFRVDSGGNGVYLFEIDDPITDYESMSITLEPVSGSESPSEPPIVLVRVDDFRDRIEERLSEA